MGRLELKNLSGDCERKKGKSFKRSEVSPLMPGEGSGVRKGSKEIRFQRKGGILKLWGGVRSATRGVIRKSGKGGDASLVLCYLFWSGHRGGGHKELILFENSWGSAGVIWGGMGWRKDQSSTGEGG